MSGVRPSVDVDAVLFDFGGVLSDSPFDAFGAYEAENGLEPGFIRRLNADNHHENAWARLERNEVTFDEFCDLFQSEARDRGATVDARDLFTRFSGAIRPAMIDAVRACGEHFKTGLLTNNFVSPLADEQRGEALAEVLAMFDVVVESSVVGVRKPDPRFYAMACDALGVHPTRSVFLDDLGVNLKPARNMGMITIKVVEPVEALRELGRVVGLELGS